jgi:hypothetical protein
MSEAITALGQQLTKFMGDVTATLAAQAQVVTDLKAQNATQAAQIADLQTKVSGSADDAATIADLTAKLTTADAALVPPVVSPPGPTATKPGA